MKCPKCGLILSVMGHKEVADKVVLELTCRNPQCPNHHKVVTEIDNGTPTVKK